MPLFALGFLVGISIPLVVIGAVVLVALEDALEPFDNDEESR